MEPEIGELQEDGYTYIGNGLYADYRSCEERGEHWWFNSSSIDDERRSERCRQCGAIRYGRLISEEERATARAEIAVLQARLRAADGVG